VSGYQPVVVPVKVIGLLRVILGSFGWSIDCRSDGRLSNHPTRSLQSGSS
jgi:hypothetical protein